MLVYGASNVKRISQFLPENVLTFSFPGWTSEDLVQNAHGLTEILTKNPTVRTVIVSASTNDLGSLLPFETLRNLRLLHTQCQHVRQFVVMLTPDCHQLNEQILQQWQRKTIALPPNTREFFENDHVHLNEKGSLIIAQELLDRYYCDPVHEITTFNKLSFGLMQS